MLTHVKWKTDNRTQTCSHSSCFLLCACSTSSHIAFTLEKLWHIIFQNIYKIYFNYIIIYLQLCKTAPKNWCFQTVVLEKTLKSPLDSNEIQSVHSKDQSWVFFGRTDSKAEAPVLWPPHMKSWLIGKDPDAGRDWGQEEKGTTENEIAGWHHWLNGHEFVWTPGVGDGQEAWCAVIHGVAKSRTRLSDWSELNWKQTMPRKWEQSILSCQLGNDLEVGIFLMFLP